MSRNKVIFMRILRFKLLQITVYFFLCFVYFHSLGFKVEPQATPAANLESYHTNHSLEEFTISLCS
jgi:hypothetical protein